MTRKKRLPARVSRDCTISIESMTAEAYNPVLLLDSLLEEICSFHVILLKSSPVLFSQYTGGIFLRHLRAVAF